MTQNTFVGFGFGAIQAGLFGLEAHVSGRFNRLVVAEVVPDTIRALREAGGAYRVNVASRDGVRAHAVDRVTLLNPAVPADRESLVSAIADAAEIATALPSVNFYGGAAATDPASILADGLQRKIHNGGPRAVIYTAENNNHAAEILEERLASRLGPAAAEFCQCLNTVIGKMSGVVTDAAEIRDRGLEPVTPGTSRAFLVEEFNRILITRIRWKGFARGLSIFEEKDDLLPFEEAKLYGHNATHALLGYMLRERGRAWMSDAAAEPDLLAFSRDAFLAESGGALCRKYAGLDPLFTPTGFGAYVDDLMERMINPHLRDAVERITRDPRRKLGWNDRLIGTIRLALAHDILPRRYARGAAAALAPILRESGSDAAAALLDIWSEYPGHDDEKRRVIDLVAR